MRTLEFNGVSSGSTPYHVLRVLLGLMLVAAGGLKALQLATEPVVARGIFESRWVLLVAIEIELLLGLLLLVGLYPQQTRRAAMLLFGLLAGVALTKILSGESSCGCFGTMRLSPWFALAQVAQFLANPIFFGRFLGPFRP